MAITRPGSIVGQVSGRIGGLVFSRNRGGDYVRNGPSPTNPQSSYQTAVRNALSLASAGWDTLTDSQRAAWVSWAQDHPVRNRLGESIRLQGNAAYVQLNSRLAYLGTAIVVAPPAVNAPDPLLSVTPTFDIGAGNFQLAYTATPLGAGLKLWVLGCLLGSPAITFVKNRLRHFYTSAAAAASPADLDTAFSARFGAPVVGQKVVLMAGVLDGTNGQLSAMLRCEGLVTTT